ncbi:MAG: DUF1028 domain-containing protein [candidate division Zixibacteria bacterium]|nr:DUF1028 domain-containing protein [candidate division Zixibacteria bacterium]
MLAHLFILCAPLLSISDSPTKPVSPDFNPYFTTFSIGACDPKAQLWGVAVQSKFPFVGNGVAWAKAGVGAVATQAYANLAFGPDGLVLAEKGLSAQQILDELLAKDTLKEQRQVGIVDKSGNAATFTGKECFNWAGGKVGKNYACQGNILTGPGVVEAMAGAFEKSEGKPLAERLLMALDSAQKVGGDRRGKESAHLLVVKKNGGYGGYGDRWIDIRVEDDPEPIDELKRLYYNVHQLYFGETDPKKLVKIDKAVCSEIQTVLKKLGYYKGETNGVYDNATRKALSDWQGWENLEMRWRTDEFIDGVVLDYMRRHYGSKK